ncbi:MAG: hypothetical protein ABL955_15410, partial [Elusimicrobiota bacterium]
MSGAAPSAKPKGSAGKPVDGAGGAPDGAKAVDGKGGGGTGGDGGGGDKSINGQVDEEAPVAMAMAGVPDVGQGVPSGKTFALKSGAIIQTQIFTKNGKTFVGFTAPMAIDGDGPLSEEDKKKEPGIDRTRQKDTSLRYTPGGESVNGRAVPFIVVSQDLLDKHNDVKLGDYATITYGGKTLYGIIADVGPRLGEASPATARGVGINPNPASGGLESAQVQYIIAPGSGKNYPIIPRKGAQVQSNGSTVFNGLVR